ncbi:hypothetical protein G3O01_10745 [Burkholderia sp. Ac-20365]|nr:hypothetical protein [Burkholderia sp. Ac-20365]
MNIQAIAPASANVSADMPLISQLRTLGSTGHEHSLFPTELAGHAAQAAVSELLGNWNDALKVGAGKSLVADVDRVLELLIAFRNRALAVLPCSDAAAEGKNEPMEIVSVRGALDPYTALMEVWQSLEGVRQPPTPASIEVDYVVRAFYFTELGLGRRKPFEQLDFADQQLLGQQVRFTPYDLGDRLSVGVVEGMLVAADRTSGGCYRLAIRTGTAAAQGGGYLTPHVYTNAGHVELIEVAPAPEAVTA